MLGCIYYTNLAKPEHGTLSLNAADVVNGVMLRGALAGQFFFGWLGDGLGRNSVNGRTLLYMAFYSLASGSRSRARPSVSGPPSAPSALGSDSASAATSYRIYGKADDNFAINVREGVLCFLDTLVLSGADEALEHMLVNVLKENMGHLNMGHRWPEQQPRHHLRRGIPSASLLQLPPPAPSLSPPTTSPFRGFPARGRAVFEGWRSVMASGPATGPGPQVLCVNSTAGTVAPP